MALSDEDRREIEGIVEAKLVPGTALILVDETVRGHVEEIHAKIDLLESQMRSGFSAAGAAYGDLAERIDDLGGRVDHVGQRIEAPRD